MPVDTLHKDYTCYKPKWEKVRALKDSKAECFIRDVDPVDPERSKKYREDGILTNFTAHTIDGFVGMIFRKDSECKLPAAIEYLRKDATGDNLSLDQCAKEACEETFVTGRYGFLSDYPSLEDKVNARDLENLDFKSRIYPYKAEEITNWAEAIINGVKTVIMVNIHEKFTTLDVKDGFAHMDDSRYITLRLTDGIYTQEIRGHDKQITQDPFPPTKKDGSTFKEIPFSFVGAQKNRPKPELPPLYDIACINIAHYKNSCSFEESIAVVGQPSLFITTSIGADDFIRLNPNGIRYGSRRGHNLGENGNAILLQASPNQLADEGMRRKEAQAVMIGARIIKEAGENETAEGARIRSASEISIIDAVATNVSDALTKNLRWCAEFMGANPDDVTFNLNYQYFEEKPDANLINAQIQLVDRGIMAPLDLRNNVRKYGLIDPSRTDEVIDAEREELDPIL